MTEPTREWVPGVFPPRAWGGPTWRLVTPDGTIICALFHDPDGEWRGVFRKDGQQATVSGPKTELAAKKHMEWMADNEQMLWGEG
jgi:hypothetical protein